MYLMIDVCHSWIFLVVLCQKYDIEPNNLLEVVNAGGY